MLIEKKAGSKGGAFEEIHAIIVNGDRWGLIFFSWNLHGYRFFTFVCL